MNRDRQLKKDMESREVQIHEEYENRHLMSEDKVKEHQKKNRGIKTTTQK